MNAREIITRELRHMGSFIPHVEVNNIINRLNIGGFVIIPRSKIEEKDKEIAALKKALKEAEDSIRSVYTSCATEGCDRPATVRFERGGVGSYYCCPCYFKVQALAQE